MAVRPSEKGIADGSNEFPLRCCSSIKLLKPGENAATHSYSLDVFPALLDEASTAVTLTCPYSSSQQDQDFCGVSVVSNKGNIHPDSASQMAFLSFLEVPYPSESQTFSDVSWNCSDHIDFQIASSDLSPSCSVDVEILDGCSETRKINEETAISAMRSEGMLNSAFPMKSGLQFGRRIMQFLMDRSAMLLRCTCRAEKCNNEKGHDITNNKCRRYKRSASFNSRRIVLFSSILSSMGTMVLIYLTLRVKQISDGLVHV